MVLLRHRMNELPALLESSSLRFLQVLSKVHFVSSSVSKQLCTMERHLSADSWQDLGLFGIDSFLISC